MNIRAIKDKIVVDVIKHEEKTSGGLFIPTQVEKAHKKGVVKSIGEEVPSGIINVGDIVVFAKFGGQVIDGDTNTFETRVLGYGEIYGVEIK